MGDGDAGGGAKPQVPPKAREPELPKGAPADVRDFASCVSNELTLKPGKLNWLKGKPTVSYAPGTTPGSIEITVDVGLGGFKLPVSVTGGELSVDTSKIPPEIKYDKKEIDDWVKDVNAWLKANGKKFGRPKIKDGVVTFPKLDAGGAPGKAAPPKAPEEKKPGIKAKAAVGVGAFLIGVGGGAAAGDAVGDDGGQIGDPGTPVAVGGNVPVEYPETQLQPSPEPQVETTTHLPQGPVDASIDITGPRSFTTPATFTQEGDRLIILVPGIPEFGGTIDPQGRFQVRNDVGSFEGEIRRNRTVGSHMFQGEEFQFTGTLAQPAVEETVTVEPPPGAVVPPAAGAIGDGLEFVAPTGEAEGGGGGFPALPFGIGMALIGAGVAAGGLRTKKDDCEKERAVVARAKARLDRARATPEPDLEAVRAEEASAEAALKEARNLVKARGAPSGIRSAHVELTDQDLADFLRSEEELDIGLAQPPPDSEIERERQEAWEAYEAAKRRYDAVQLAVMDALTGNDVEDAEEDLIEALGDLADCEGKPRPRTLPPEYAPPKTDPPSPEPKTEDVM